MPLHESYFALMTQAEKLLEADQLEQSLEIYQRVVAGLGRLSPKTLAQRPNLVEVFVDAVKQIVTLGRTLKRTDIVLQSLDTAMAALPAQRSGWAAMKARMLANAGQLEQAAELLQQTADQLDASTVAFLDLIVDEALWHNRGEEALQMIASVEQKLAGDSQEEIIAKAFVWINRYKTLCKLERADEAEQALYSARALLPKDTIGRGPLVEVLLRQGKLQKALEIADGEPQPWTRGLLRGIIAEMMGKHDWARDEWWRVVRENFDVEKIDAERADALPSWIEAALLYGELDKAQKVLMASLGKRHFAPNFLIYQALIWAKSGEGDSLDSAKRVMRTAARFNAKARESRMEFIVERDAWLIDQVIADATVRQALKEALFAPVTEEELAEAEAEWARDMDVAAEESQPAQVEAAMSEAEPAAEA
jgi:tetratricopeptide (TPR) repeat protein